MVNEFEIKKEICDIGKRIYNRGMVAANDGNISVKLNDHEFLCTPTGVSKGFMTPEYICKVDENGQVIQANKGFKPSSEIKMHIPLTQPIMPEAVIALGCVPIAEYGTPSTEEIPNAVSKYLQYFDAVLLENHGALAYSDSLLNAYHKMESVEFYAQLLFLSRQLGGPKELSKAQVERLYEIRRQFGLKGKHPANVCLNAKDGKPSCHSCGGCANTEKSCAASDEDVVAAITKKVMKELGL